MNPLAIEEHDEEMKRLDFLVAQRADLAEAKASLQQAIREIDATARELFLATFAQVRENFRQIFMTLFGGGECDLRLENPDAPLDCDIEIHASPRGKQHAAHPPAVERRARARRALAAVRHLPHEAEPVLPAGRGGRAARRREHRPLRADAEPVQERTQFIVITHNPRTTTEAARRGVRRDDAGAGRLVARERADARGRHRWTVVEAAVAEAAGATS